MKIAFIDFETANKERSSICAVGVSVQEDGVEIEHFYSLCKPEPFNVSRLNLTVNGLDYSDLIHAPLFSEIYTTLKAIIEKVDYVVSHNANFDMDCLSTYLYRHNIDFPDFLFTCSCELAKQYFKESNIYKLSDIASHFGIKYDAHNALSDAQTAGYVFWKMMKNKSCKLHLVPFTDRLEIEEEQEARDIFYGVEQIKGVTSTVSGLPFVDVDNIEIADMNFVVTGSFVHAKRKDIEDYIKTNGGKLQSTANKKTKYIVIGSMASDGWANGNYGRKIESALEIDSITFISEETFLKFMV